LLANGTNNEWIATEEQKNRVGGITTANIDLEGKTVMHVKMMIINRPPTVPLIGTSLWKVDNLLSNVRCISILPPDKPVICGQELEEQSKLVFESGQKMPLYWNQN